MKNSIVIYGGSFNPPLNSHFSIAQETLNQFSEIEKIIFVPVNKNYEKKGLLSNEHRCNMLKKVIDKNEKFDLSLIDMEQNYSMTTVETLDKMQEQYKDKELWFLTGSDNLKDISKWIGGEELLEKYKLLIKARENDDISEIIKNDSLLLKYKKNIKVVSEQIRSNYSSTYVRSQIKKQKSVRYLMPDEVYKYIEEYKLYR